MTKELIIKRLKEGYLVKHKILHSWYVFCYQGLIHSNRTIPTFQYPSDWDILPISESVDYPNPLESKNIHEVTNVPVQ